MSGVGKPKKCIVITSPTVESGAQVRCSAKVFFWEKKFILAYWSLLLVLGALWTVLDGSRHFQYVLFERDRCSIVLRGVFRCEALSNVIAVTYCDQRRARTAQTRQFLMQKAIRDPGPVLGAQVHLDRNTGPGGVQPSVFSFSGLCDNAFPDRKRRGRSI